MSSFYGDTEQNGFEVLCGLPNLATLLLGGNEFRDLSSFPPIPSLLDLDLKSNKVHPFKIIALGKRSNLMDCS